MEIIRFGVYWANLDPTIGVEMKKTRPVVVVSPDVMNNNLGTVLICPLTNSPKLYPTRVSVKLNNKQSFVAIDQMRAIDKTRLLNKISVLSQLESNSLIERVIEVLKND